MAESEQGLPSPVSLCEWATPRNGPGWNQETEAPTKTHTWVATAPVIWTSPVFNCFLHSTNRKLGRKWSSRDSSLFISDGGTAKSSLMHYTVTSAPEFIFFTVFKELVFLTYSPQFHWSYKGCKDWYPSWLVWMLIFHDFIFTVSRVWTM